MCAAPLHSLERESTHVLLFVSPILILTTFVCITTAVIYYGGLLLSSIGVLGVAVVFADVT